MEIALPLSVDTAGSVVLQADEVQYIIQEGIDVHDRDVKTGRRRGVAILTSHRLCWIDAARRDPIAWHLGHVVAIEEEEGTFIVGSSKIVIRLRARFSSSNKLTGPAAAASASADADTTHIKFAFKTGGRDEFLNAARTALTRRSWAAPAVPAHGGSPVAPAPKVADIVARPGIAGILERKEREQETSKSLANAAFSDLAELEKYAKPLVALAERYAAESASRRAAAAASAVAPPSSGSSPGASPTTQQRDSSTDAGREQQQFADLVSTMGIVNPVTRSACGSGSNATLLYYSEVARQLAGFCRYVAAQFYNGYMRALCMCTLQDTRVTYAPLCMHARYHPSASSYAQAAARARGWHDDADGRVLPVQPCAGH